jgi:F-type H+-transporting ATPase subunit b
MPQFDSTYFISQLFWLVICFGCLVLYLSWVAIPKIKQGMNLRKNTIEDLLGRKNAYEARMHEITLRIQALKHDESLQSKEFMHELAQKLEGEKEDILKTLHGKFREERLHMASHLMDEIKDIQKNLPTLTTDILTLMEDKIFHTKTHPGKTIIKGEKTDVLH